jgi:hypothetical protein
MSDAVARAFGWSPIARVAGWRPARCHPFPYALLGPAAALQQLAIKLAGGSPETDADRMAAILLSGGPPNLVLDLSTQVFHVLDGTGTDAVAVEGRVHVGGEEPLVLLDPLSGGRALARMQVDLDDGGSRDLARLLRYDGAIDDVGEISMPAPSILVGAFWTGAFCSTIIRAAETAAAWANPGEGSTPFSEVSLLSLSSRLFSLIEDDLLSRIWPRVVSMWPQAGDLVVDDIVVVRQEAGEAGGTTQKPPAGALFGGSVRLNEGYGGGALLFPRQTWDDGRMSVGSISLWPWAESHPRRVESVSRGVKYALNLSWRRPSGQREEGLP